MQTDKHVGNQANWLTDRHTW